MSATRKISNFRQLSFTCESPSPHQKRRSLKKQFSEDIPDFKDPWCEHGSEIHIALQAKTPYKKGDRPPPVRIAWGDAKPENFGLNEEVIIKKCKEVKRVSSGKLTRHPSLEKDSSILNSKQDLAERLRGKSPQADKENDKVDGKPNLQIFLAHNTQDSQTIDNNLESSIIDNSDHQLLMENPPPKYLQPLVTQSNNKAFQIKKTPGKKPLMDSPLISQKRPNLCRSNTIVVIPLVVEKDSAIAPSPIINEENKYDDPNGAGGINVIIRPMTAQSRRERFQKRTNSAFHGASKDQLNFRPPLVRSSSAPCTKSSSEKSKFLASKRKLKGSKKLIGNSPKGSSNSSVEAKEWKNAAAHHTGSDIVTMVSLMSPSGSENDEDGSEDDLLKERPKSVLKRESSIVIEKSAAKEEAAGSKNVSLRKTVKSVSFQQSSIHAVRSFSASFPARRGSMATALTASGNANVTNAKPSASKMQEKRGTNPSSPDANERVPKRRLVRSSTDDTNKSSSSWQRAASQITRTDKGAEEIRSTFTVDIQTKNSGEAKFAESSMKLNLEENVILIAPEENKQKGNNNLGEEERKQSIDQPTYDTPKEKQCWAMYCKMTEKGINVSYDTILRGMLTPTEYRIRRKTSIVEEMNMLVNPPSEETNKMVPSAE